jgi:hypothetical protein
MLLTSRGHKLLSITHWLKKTQPVAYFLRYDDPANECNTSKFLLTARISFLIAGYQKRDRKLVLFCHPNPRFNLYRIFW